jgi:hypothetical protein
VSGVSNRARVYRCGIAIREDGVDAVVFDLPGCQTQVANRDDAVAVLPVVIAEHLAWLDGHGQVTRDAFPFAVEVVEEVDVPSLAGVADGEFLFADDLRPVSRGEVEEALLRLAFARRDLLAVVRGLPDAVLDWRPPSAALRTDPWAPERRSIRDVLGHLAAADTYYAFNVGAAPPPLLSDAARADLFGQRDRAVQRYRSLSEADLAARFEKRQPWQTRGAEHWTVRKALRRAIGHERFHCREVEQRLAWLLLGAPELSPAAGRSRERGMVLS